MRLVIIAVVLLIAAFAIYLLVWPTRIDPVAVTVGPNPGLVGVFSPNQELRRLRWLGETAGRGPEDVAVKDGFAYTGLEDGRIVRVRIDGTGAAETIANTAGRPLGLEWDPFGNLVVADAKKGLLVITPNRAVHTIVDKYLGKRLLFVNDVDIAADGTIYFSDASERHGIDEYVLDFIEGRPTGRLFSYDIRRNETKLRLDQLAFANGVALGPDEEYVLAAEMAAHRIRRYWLKGAKQGQTDIFYQNLPGYPDNLSYDGERFFWVALTGPRVTSFESALANPFVRRVQFRLQSIGLMAFPAPERYGWVVAIDPKGQVVANLQDPGGTTIPGITSVNEVDGVLYLGSLQTDRIAAFQLAPPR